VRPCPATGRAFFIGRIYQLYKEGKSVAVPVKRSKNLKYRRMPDKEIEEILNI